MAGGEPAQKPRLGKLSEADERRLVEAAQQDRAHFGAVYEKYFEVVYAYVARRVRDRAVTEDLTSEVFRKALAHLPRFKWTGAWESSRPPAPPQRACQPRRACYKPDRKRWIPIRVFRNGASAPCRVTIFISPTARKP